MCALLDVFAPPPIHTQVIHMNSVPKPSADSLKLLVFIGTVRESTPPRPARLGLRVARACEQWFQQRKIDIQMVDPLDIPMDRVFKPHFSYAKQKAPAALDSLAQKIDSADGFVMVSPEYNHAMSPALADLLNHFGSSLFAYKPSAIVTYSAGQWGGARAAVNMRTFLSELGCLPVSAMVHVPHADRVFESSGRFVDDGQAQAWDGYIGRTLEQLIWWATAARLQRGSDAVIAPGPMTQAPSERDAPQSGE